MKTMRTNKWVGTASGLCLMAMVTVAFGQTTVTRIPTLGGEQIQAKGLNNSGGVTGLSRTANNEQHAFLFSGGSMLDLMTLPDGFVSQATALNDAGDVVGDSDTVNGEVHAFLYHNGSMIDLDTPGSFFSTAAGVNGARDVIGQVFTPEFSFHAFLYRNGSMTDIGTLGGANTSVSPGPANLNASGDVVGESQTAGGQSRAFLYRNGSMTSLGILTGGTVSRAFAINDAGVIVGEADNSSGQLRAFVYQNGTMTALPTLGGSQGSAYAINATGQILGDSLVADDVDYHAFLYSNGTMTDLGTLGGTYSAGNDLNNLGHVVGEAENASTNVVPFLWRNGTMVDVNSLLPTNSGWLLFTAEFINDNGQIVGAGLHNGEFAYYVLTLGSENQPPVANAGADQTVECGSLTRLDGTASSDPDGDSLGFVWREGGVLLGNGAVLNVSLGSGTHVVTLTVTDPDNARSEDTVTITVVDTIAPAVSCPNSQSASADANCQAAVPDFASSAVALDDCSSPSTLIRSQSPAAGTLVGLGTHVVTVSVTDPSGNVGTCTTSFTVVDTTAPTGNCPDARTIGAGPECHAAVPDFTAGLLATDNCTPPSLLVKTQTPSAGTMVGLGSLEVRLTVRDAAGNESMCATMLHVVDNTAPSVSCPDGVTVEVEAECQATVPDFTASTMATDNCSEVVTKTQSPAAGTVVGRGTHVVTVTVTDAAGNHASCTTTFSVVDRTPPVITALSVSPNVLTTVNRDLVPVTVSVTATDNCDRAPVCRILSITSDEPVTGPSDNTSPDWEVPASGLTAQVRAERSNKGDGRTYTITVICTDASGNSSTGTVTVTVPGKKGGPGKDDALTGAAAKKALAALTSSKKKKK
jgi:probable HAF family extracellular repeat protein